MRAGYLYLQNENFTTHVTTSTFIYTSDSTENAVRKYDSEANELWSYTLPQYCEKLVINSQNQIIAGCRNGSVYIFEPDGTLSNSFTTSAGVITTIDVDASDNIYVAGTNQSVIKYDPSGVLQWTYSGQGATQLTIKVDSSGNVYSGDLNGVLKKIDPSGAEISSKTLNTRIESIINGDSDSLYVGTAGRVYKFDNLGTELWRFYGSGQNIRGLDYKDGYLYIGSNDNYIRKVEETTRTIIWSEYTDNDTNAVCIGDDNYIYSTEYNAIRKLDIDGNLVYAYSPTNALYYRDMVISRE